VVEELVNGAVTRTYTYGYERISQSQTLSHAWTPSFYIYDGRGTVRMMASLAGTVTDTYEYDAFGNMLAKTGATPNVYLYRGERYDSDLKLYYLRARWYNPVTGRFMTRDPYSGSAYDPASLHRYNYARSNPSNFVDPSGRAALSEYALEFTNQAAKNVAVGAVGLSVNCMIRADAGILYLVGEFSHDNQTVIDAKADFKNCMASVTVEQLAESALFAWGSGVVLEELGGMLQEALQGAFPKVEAPFFCKLCFAAGTPVHTDHGAVPIERIKVGDKVWTHNSATGKNELKCVTHVAAQHRDKLLELRVEGEHAPLHPTPTHPFWARRDAAPNGAWIKAGDLRAGDQLEAQDGRWVGVLSVAELDKLAVVYNFTVEDDHDYFVGDEGLLVHNQGPGAGLDALAQFRADLGLQPGEGTLSSLDIGGQTFYGINAHGQPITMPVNAISASHAEADAFQQAINAGATGGEATLTVDRPLCLACGQNGGIRSMMRNAGVNRLNVVTPEGTQVFTCP